VGAFLEQLRVGKVAVLLVGEDAAVTGAAEGGTTPVAAEVGGIEVGVPLAGGE
jgi:hypothetical protein